MLERQSCWLDLWTTTQRRDVAPRLIGVVAKEAAGFTNVVDARMRLINLVSWKKPTSLFFSPPRNWDEISPLWDGTVIRNPCTMDSLQTFSRKKQQKIQNKWNEINNNNNLKKCKMIPPLKWETNRDLPMWLFFTCCPSVDAPHAQFLFSAASRMR